MPWVVHEYHCELGGVRAIRGDRGIAAETLRRIRPLMGGVDEGASLVPAGVEFAPGWRA